MLLNKKQDRKKAMVLTAVALFIILVLLGIVFTERSEKTGIPTPMEPPKTTLETEETVKEPEAMSQGRKVVTGVIEETKPIDFQALDQEGAQKDLMDERKSSLGIKESLDMIVKSDETFIVGESKVSMQKIIEQAFAKKGKVYEEELSESGSSSPARINEYGIYVVQPGDNIWNIHFGILKDFYAAKGMALKSRADEPGSGGQSSGVGKILKFSEAMVIIYNLKEGRVVNDINLLEPLSKIVVYNMKAVFNLLEEIDFDNINRIQFDGKNIWIPAKQS